jgi:hypothetical protein
VAIKAEKSGISVREAAGDADSLAAHGRPLAQPGNTPKPPTTQRSPRVLEKAMDLARSLPDCLRGKLRAANGRVQARDPVTRPASR